MYQEKHQELDFREQRKKTKVKQSKATEINAHTDKKKY